MGNTLVDEPVPPTQSHPPAEGRPTLDDVPAAPQAVTAQVAPLRASPTLVDAPPAAAPGPGVQSGASPTQPDAPPAQAQKTPPAAPLLAGAAAAPPSEPRGNAVAGIGLSPSGHSPAPQGAPPPLAFPAKPAPAPGILAQLPAMPGPRAALPPHLVATPVPAASPSPASVPAPSEEPPAREALPPPVAASADTASKPAAPQGSIPARLPPGARTIVGVAPAPAPLAGTPGDLGAAREAAANSQSANSQSANSRSAVGGDPAAQAVHPAAEMRPTVTDTPKKSGARKWIAGIFAVLGVLAIAAVVIGYFVLVRYTPLADRHIPAASNVAIRADARQIATFAPVRKHLWPVLADRPSQKAGKTFADRVAEDTGIHPALDVREIIVASMDAKSWVLLVGGNFEPGKFVPGMEKVMHDEGHPGWHRSGDLLVGPTGIAMGQAEDGTLVLGTEAEIVTASLPASDENKRMQLPKDGALSFALSKEAFEELSRDTGMFDPTGALRRIRHMRGTLSLGDEPGVDLDIEPKGGENPDTLGKDVESFLGKLRLGLVLFPDHFGEKTALSSAKVAVETEHVRVRGTWPLEGLDRGCQKLVALLGL